MLLRQYGQSRVAGGASTSSGLKRAIRAFTGRTTKKYITKATIRKLIIALIKAPTFRKALWL